MPAFYQTYRPKVFSELIGQEHIVKTLENAIRTDRIGHAYLFTGPRGTGKTTLARLLAKSANCTNRKGVEPCGKCESCMLMNEGKSLDLIEFDAATHTQVDKMREILEGVPIPPVSGRYKIYIIDEAHMLSPGAWNAFLKTLEEPPAHAVFILATTALHKVPETIVSRCQRFDLSRFPVESIVEKLTRIAKKEKLKIEDGALRMIAIAAEGGMRDAESLFSQVSTLQESPITEADAASILGVTETAKLENLARHLAAQDLPAAIHVIRELSESGENFTAFLPTFLRYLETLLLLSIDADVAEDNLAAFDIERRKSAIKLAETLSPDRLVEIIEHFQEAENRLRLSSLPELAVEVAVAKSIPSEKQPTTCEHIEEEEEEEINEDDISKAPVSDFPSNKPITVPQEETDSETQTAQCLRTKTGSGTKPKNNQTTEQDPEHSDDSHLSLVDVRDRWHEILREATRINASLTLALSNANPKEVRGGEVTIAVRFPFHRDRLIDPANALTLEEAFGTILSAKPRISVVVDPSAGKTDHPLISQALSALGGEVI